VTTPPPDAGQPRRRSSRTTSRRCSASGIATELIARTLGHLIPHLVEQEPKTGTEVHG
jgi:hypothetical protein